MQRTGFILSVLMAPVLCISMALYGQTGPGTRNRMVLWSQSDSSHNNFRIPAIIVTAKGSLLAFAEGREGGDSGDIDILLKRSEDGGRSWSDQLVVWDDGPNTCGNPCPVVDRSTGRIILFMTWNAGSDHEDQIIRKLSADTRRPFMTYSDDEGISWAEPVEMSSCCKNPDWGWYATGPGVGIQLKSEEFRNRLVIPCNHSYTVADEKEEVRGGYGYGSHVLYSDDGGQNWSMSEAIAPACNESQVVELSNGDLLMNMRSYNKQACRAISISRDGGRSWSEIRHDKQLIEPVCQASLIAYGRHLRKPTFLFSNPANSASRTHMTLKASLDDCLTWTGSLLIHEGPAAYSCLCVLPDGRIGIFYEAGEQHPYESMVFETIDPHELIK